ncbi:hypothetical protein AXG93_4698s1090 [Marchantia polymorpha subsp. ruderalis]|uniref:Uncharacterized protein n=3 Tax=Marchantia polymorpha TaxID=3197 RepID=A0A176VHP3_MARPO|nr:hypothetical protein AXG93_4698s1090 [Marchantia polymorpha subsp. ruderalis]
MGPPMPSSLGEQHGEHGLNHADTCHACVRVCDRALRSAITRSILSEDKACSVHSLIARTAPHSIIELMALSAIISNRTNPSTGSETWRLNRTRSTSISILFIRPFSYQESFVARKMSTNQYNQSYDATAQKTEQAKDATANTFDRTKQSAAEAADKTKNFGAEKTEQAKQIGAEKTEQAQNTASNVAGTVQEKSQNVWDQTKQTAADANQYVQEKAGQASQYAADCWEATKQTAADTTTATQNKAVDAKNFTVDKAVQGKDYTVDKASQAGQYTSDTAVSAKNTTASYLQQGVDAVKGAVLGTKDALMGETGANKPGPK